MIARTPVIAGQQGRPVGNEVADPHAGPPRHPDRVRHISAQRHRFFEPGNDRENVHDVAGAKFHRYRIFQPGLDDAARSAIHSLYQSLPACRYRGQAARELQGLLERAALAQFVNSARIHAPGQRHLRADLRDVDDVAGQEALILGFISGEQQVVKVEIGNCAAQTLQLDVPHGTVRIPCPRRRRRSPAC